MALTRLMNWAEIPLHNFLDDWLKHPRPFAWAVNDCCTFVADAVEAQTGVRIDSDFRGRYHDEASAFALIHAVTGGSGVADAIAWCATQHGLTERDHPLMASRGEMVVCRNGVNLIAGVVHLSGRHVAAMGEHGPVRLSILDVVRAWAFA
jgi:hypothetical protein